MSVWAPQLIKSFGLSNVEIGLVNAILWYSFIAMILWGRSSDRKNERLWHTATALLMISFGLLIALFTSSLIGTIFLLSIVLIGAYSAKGPFSGFSILMDVTDYK